MQPIDLIKLIYQNEFGGGHFIDDPQKSLLRIVSEYANNQVKNQALYTPIGNGFVRLNLAAIDIKTLSLEDVNRMFVLSANNAKGALEMFNEKTQYALHLQKKERIFPFPYKDLFCCIEKHSKAGFPPVSHSPEFRNFYHPSYRVVKECYL